MFILNNEIQNYESKICLHLFLDQNSCAGCHRQGRVCGLSLVTVVVVRQSRGFNVSTLTKNRVDDDGVSAIL